MISKFLNVEKEKQDRILNAALKEFADKGFTNASTNEIVKEAGISKGLLFHYFKNKKELFLFLYDYFLEVVVEDLFARIDHDEGDILIKWRSIAWIKFELMKKHPDMFDFLRVAYEEAAPEVKSDLDKRSKDLLNSSYAKLLRNIDFSKFKEGIDVEKALNTIIWTLEGFANQQQEKTKNIPLDQLDMETLLKAMDEYIDLLRTAFYK